MSKFKIGDRIVFIKNIGDSGFDWTIGKTGIVKGTNFSGYLISNKYSVEIVIEDEDINYWCREVVSSPEE